MRICVLVTCVLVAVGGQCSEHLHVANHTAIYTSGRYLISPPVDIGTWKPLQISFYPLEITQITSDFYPKLTNDFLPAVTSWYSKVLTTNPLISGKIIPSVDYCDDVQVPHQLQTDGVTADLLVFVSYGLGDYEAWATICQVVTDMYHRPVIGHIHLQGEDQFLNMTWGQTFAVIAHQVAHVLAFNNELFPYFQKSIGEFYGAAGIIGTRATPGSSASFIMSPNVQSHARAAFGCDSMEGVDIEGTVLATDPSVHWDKRFMYQDFMVADVNPYDVGFSDISLALFQDSGWYEVNYDYTSSIVWGYQRGCSWVFSLCITSETAISSEFCDNPTTPRCDFTYTKKGACSYTQLTTPIPSPYQYFKSPYIGGSDVYANYCPTVLPNPLEDCTGAFSSPTPSVDVYGEMVCPECRCIEGTFVSQTSSVSPVQHTSCHKVTCEGSVATITIGIEVAKCLPDGKSTTVRGFQGLVNCPTSDVLCRPLPCFENCHGHGMCQSGACVCEDGWTGQFCQFGMVLFTAYFLTFALLVF